MELRYGYDRIDPRAQDLRGRKRRRAAYCPRGRHPGTPSRRLGRAHRGRRAHAGDRGGLPAGDEGEAGTAPLRRERRVAWLLDSPDSFNLPRPKSMKNIEFISRFILVGMVLSSCSAPPCKSYIDRLPELEEIFKIRNMFVKPMESFVIAQGRMPSSEEMEAFVPREYYDISSKFNLTSTFWCDFYSSVRGDICTLIYEANLDCLIGCAYRLKPGWGLKKRPNGTTYNVPAEKGEGWVCQNLDTRYFIHGTLRSDWADLIP